MVIIDNLNEKLKQLSDVLKVVEYYDYLKIDINCVIDYCDEYLVLYAKVVEDTILITDLGAIYEDAIINGIDNKTIRMAANNCDLSFEENKVFIKININNIEESIQRFINMVKMLNL